MIAITAKTFLRRTTKAEQRSSDADQVLLLKDIFKAGPKGWQRRAAPLTAADWFSKWAMGKQPERHLRFGRAACPLRAALSRNDGFP